jgi:predicted outer membrane repeat protein
MSGSAAIRGNEATYGGGVYFGSGNFDLSSGTISGNKATNGGGVYVDTLFSTFAKTGGTINGYNGTADTTHTPPENTATSAANGAGHAVYDNTGTPRYRDSTLGTGVNISISDPSTPPWE